MKLRRKKPQPTQPERDTQPADRLNRNALTDPSPPPPENQEKDGQLLELNREHQFTGVK